MATSSYIVIDSEIDPVTYPTNTAAEIAVAIEALWDAGLDYAFVWVGEESDAVKTDLKVFARAVERIGAEEIVTAADVLTWVANNSPGNCVEMRREEAVSEAIRAADHPPYGEDWSGWLDAHAEQIALGAMAENEGVVVNTTAQSAIKTSIRENRIVTLAYAALGSAYVPVRDALAAESEDSVLNGDRYEFWGTDADGDEWRVHMVTP